MKTAFESIKRGLQEAIEHAEGHSPPGTRIHRPHRRWRDPRRAVSRAERARCNLAGNGLAPGRLGVENGGSADAWIAQQAAYDLWKARAAGAPVVQRAPEVRAA